MLIEQTLFGVRDKVQEAIKRLQAYEPTSEPYRLAFSGGKDSVVILALAKMAGVKYEAVYNVTSVDPPELVRFIKEKYPEVKREIPHDKNGKPVTMWSLLRSRCTPPTRSIRYCCEKLKEATGKGRVVITGVRWAESGNRKHNQGTITIMGKGSEKIKELEGVDFSVTRTGGVIMNDDNDETRRVVESCYRTRKTLVNPIIDWEDEDVWEFINKYDVPYCELYDQGMKRLGCVGCPLSGRSVMLRDFERYPKYKAEYLRCFDKMIQTRKERAVKSDLKWESGQDIFNWWIREADKTTNEITLFDESEEDNGTDTQE